MTARTVPVAALLAAALAAAFAGACSRQPDGGVQVSVIDHLSMDGHPTAGQHRKATLMVKIRLTRGGAKKRPFYHIIVTDSRSARDGRNIERVGFYNPVAAGNEKRVELNIDRVKHWVANGAQLTDKVADLYKQAVKAAPAA